MGETGDQRIFRKHAAILSEIGDLLTRVELPEIEVRLPEALAQAAVDAWEWDAEEPLGAETPERRLQRHRAATLALIGLAIRERGGTEGDEVVVALHPELIGLAIDAADDSPKPTSRQ